MLPLLLLFLLLMHSLCGCSSTVLNRTKRSRDVEYELVPDYEVVDENELLNIEELNTRNLASHIGTLNDDSPENARKGLKFLAKYGLIANNRKCGKCGHPYNDFMVLSKDKSVKHDKFVWRCRDCRKLNNAESRISMRSGSFLEDRKLTIQEVIYLAADWIETPSRRIADTVKQFKISAQTVVDLQESFRRMTEQWFVREGQTHLKLGGPGKVVELDETLVVRAKYNRGRNLRRKQIWVFGMYERGSNKIVMCTVPKRDAATLLPIIESYVEDDTMIMSDGWAAYGGISALGRNYQHGVVNHKYNFVNPTDKRIHTQSIESSWNALKAKLRGRFGTPEGRLGGHMFNYMWRRFFDGKYLLNRLLIEMKTYREGILDDFYFPPDDDVEDSDDEDSDGSENINDDVEDSDDENSDGSENINDDAEDSDDDSNRGRDRNKKINYNEKEDDSDSESDEQQTDEYDEDEEDEEEVEDEETVDGGDETGSEISTATVRQHSSSDRSSPPLSSKRPSQNRPMHPSKMVQASSDHRAMATLSSSSKNDIPTTSRTISKKKRVDTGVGESEEPTSVLQVDQAASGSSRKSATRGIRGRGGRGSRGGRGKVIERNALVVKQDAHTLVDGQVGSNQPISRGSGSRVGRGGRGKTIEIDEKESTQDEKSQTQLTGQRGQTVRGRGGRGSRGGRGKIIGSVAQVGDDSQGLTERQAGSSQPISRGHGSRAGRGGRGKATAIDEKDDARDDNSQTQLRGQTVRGRGGRGSRGGRGKVIGSVAQVGDDSQGLTERQAGSSQPISRGRGSRAGRGGRGKATAIDEKDDARDDNSQTQLRGQTVRGRGGRGSRGGQSKVTASDELIGDDSQAGGGRSGQTIRVRGVRGGRGGQTNRVRGTGGGRGPGVPRSTT